MAQSSFTGTVVNGILQLDEPVGLADESRVQVTIVPLDDWRERWRQALSALQELRKTHPLHLGGARFNRDELYDRR